MKWLGAMLFVCGCYFFGLKLGRDEEERLTSVDSLIELLNLMKRRISYERTPIYEIFSSFSNKYLEETGFLEVMSRRQSRTRSDIERALSSFSLDEDIATEIIRFFTELGTVTLDEQLKKIDFTLSVLTERREKLKNEVPTKKKTLKTVCLLFGALTTIILL